jgi:hypothetical protein
MAAADRLNMRWFGAPVEDDSTGGGAVGEASELGGDRRPLLLVASRSVGTGHA